MFTSVILLKAATEQIPTYKQYKYLRPDPTEAEMDQPTVNKEMDIKKLSEVASVTVRCNLAVHRLVTPFVIWQAIQRPRLLERVYKPMHTSH